MEISSKRSRKGERFLLSAIAVVVASTFSTGVAMAQEDAEKDATELDAIEVTGSRIKRAQAEGALPVTVIDRQQIEMSGQISVADLLRDTTFNSFGSIKPQSGSSAQSFAQLSLRGLGGGRTLILIDGKRAPLEPSFAEGGQNLNTIPLAAVERIEILSDGASAIYGADAIGGVVNIITRKDFNGVELKGGFSRPARDGGETEDGSALFGVSSGNARLVAGASFNNRGIVFQRERPWSTGGLSTYGNNFRTVTPDPVTGAPSEGGFYDDPTNGAKVPGGCGDPQFIETDTRCFYDFTALAADEADVKQQSMFARAAYDINEDWTVNFNTSVSRLRTFGRYAPVPEVVFVPADSPNNPYDEDLFLRHRFAALGTRDNYTDTQVYDYDLFANGNVLGMFDLEFGARRSDSKYSEFGYNYLSIPVAEQYIADGTYDIANPLANDPAVLADMRHTATRDGFDKNDYLYANVGFTMGQLPAGPIQWFVGTEWRNERYQDFYDQQSVAGNVGGSSGNSSFGGRRSVAYFGEAVVPVLENLELDFAVRRDKYDDFGSATSPKVSLRFQPLDILTFRASYGEGFRAPPLPFLKAERAFSADSVVDPATAAAFGVPADTQIQVNAYRIPNPGLEAEDSKQYAAGIALDPADWINLTIDYFNIKIDNQIAFFDVSTLVGREQDGLPIPTGLGVFRNADGSINFVNTGYGNEGSVQTDGIDLNVKTKFGFGEYGQLSNYLQATYTMSYEVCGIDGCDDIVGTDPEYIGGGPEWRAQLMNAYKIMEFTLAWNMNVVGKFNTAAGDFEIAGEDPEHGIYITHDVQVSWEAPWNGTLTVGADNVFDRDPLLDPYGGRGYVTELSDPYGRVPYVRYTQRF